MATPQAFEDFRLGQRFAGGGRTVTAEDLAMFAAVSGDRHPLHTDADFARSAGFSTPIGHGLFGAAAFFGWFFESGIAAEALVAALDIHWRFVKPIYAGDQISFEMTITRCRRTSSGNNGVIARHVRVINGGGEMVQEGRTALLVRARGSQTRVPQELFTKAWAALVAERLNASAEFRAATATWDGCFALASEDDETQFRVFKGRVIDAGERSPNGPAFVMRADELTWADLVTGPSNDLMARAMKGQFSVSGSAYEYLRLTKALNHVIDAMRALFAQIA